MKQLTLLIISALFLTGCLEAALVPLEEQQEIEQTLKNPKPIWSASSTLRAVTDQFGGGFGEGYFLDNGDFIFKLRVNLLPPQEGKYVAWLKRAKPETYVLMGTLVSPKNDGNYVLGVRGGASEHVFVQPEDLRDHTEVIVSLEPNNDTDPMPGDLMLLGKITVVKSG